ncbi:hypothetical protein LTR56_015381 [Elasticomyces elasticus]|nr:hypothetical protein LTR56_015381 [Elasticomyces elasticus]KAK3637493.1 hypothetical protein LTR22_018216 [Elasticomyces elasticus]KAK4911475.1 hypothetical protein LTR49_019970 [Elasticomyces elasticus]KAK5768055.1 hypothetical protein LTS12_001872 [Elasticomyces elasticus]
MANLNAPPTPPPATLPPELWLTILPLIPYTPTQFSALRLISHHHNDLLTLHEKSLASHLKTQAFDPLTLQLFPGISISSYTHLATLHTRLQTLQDLKAKWSAITTAAGGTANTNTNRELAWLEGRYEAVFTAGTLLLYRLQDTTSAGIAAGTHHIHSNSAEGTVLCPHCAKLSLIASLPASSLACLLFVLVAAVKILRVHGPDPINARWCKEDLEIRSEVELACEEVLLGRGPGVFMGLLVLGEEGGWALSVLQAEIAGMGDRQQTFASGQSKPATLISALRAALSEKTGCGKGQVVGRMWEILSGTKFDRLGEEGEMMGRLVRGEEVGGGGKRMGF